MLSDKYFGDVHVLDESFTPPYSFIRFVPRMTAIERSVSKTGSVWGEDVKPKGS